MPDLALRIEKSKNVLFKNNYTHVNNDEIEILSGLQKSQKFINPKYFYDTYGSELFEKITTLPEYYLTRSERSILTKYASEIAELCGTNAVLIEPGSGSSEKVRLLLSDLRPKTYVPMDIASEFLQRSAVKLGEEYPWLNVHAICTDFTDKEETPKSLPEGKRIIFYPGSTLGNMTPESALDFLSMLRGWLKPKGGMLVGVDLHKSKSVLDAAYNDAQGVTARFNLNALDNINRLAQANFDTANFSHKAFYNDQEKRIEMHLESKIDHIVKIGQKAISLTKGESIHTENSYKYTLEGFQSLVEKAGFKIETSWFDNKKLFGVHYLSVQK